jgi:ATP-dependent helicase/nuclease subunit B
MILSVCAPALSAALAKLKEMVARNEQRGRKTVIFCEDRLSLVAERVVCAAVEGTFFTSVYSFARFLSSERGVRGDVLSSQGSAMVIRKIIEEERPNLKLFARLSSAAAAQSVYDTLAVLYASRVTADDIQEAHSDNKLLSDKLHDLALIYQRYDEYLAVNNVLDRNSYLRLLPDIIVNSDKIKHSDVIILGFQSFTHSVAECVRACMTASSNVCGLFIGGKEDVYTNEALANFEGLAAQFGGCERDKAEGTLLPEADHIRRNIFNPDSFYEAEKMQTDRVHLYEAADENDELEMIAATIKRYVQDDEMRYAKISVMLPNVKEAEGNIERVFRQYEIPYYLDARRSLSEHPVCAFVLHYLMCASGGCLPADVDAVISSPMFGGDRKQKDIFRNYCMRLANYRGGVKRQPNRQICENCGFDYDAVMAVRERFLNGVKLLPIHGTGEDICGAIRSLLKAFFAQERMEELAKKYEDSYPVQAAFNARVPESLEEVLSEAQTLTQGMSMTVREFSKILKSGFTACEIALIPPKADAVFIGDVATTANTGSDVVFAAGLTSAVPQAGADTALLTDREITSLETLNVNISPKMQQVNARARELTALNVCAFRCQLYLSYPVRSKGVEQERSEIIAYIRALFRNAAGKPLTPITRRQLMRNRKAFVYFCSEKIPAAKRLVAGGNSAATSAVYEALVQNGYERLAQAVTQPERGRGRVTLGKELFAPRGSVSPTTLETYFTCPYLNFMQRGLGLSERDASPVRALDTGNFFHAVLKQLADEIDTISDQDACRKRVKEISENLLSQPPYSALGDSLAGKYGADKLSEEVTSVALGVYEHIKNSSFRIEKAETGCTIELADDVKLYGKIDRIDGFGDMVRIIDYKTGNIDAKPDKYYMGLKLQLPLYLTAAAKGRRGVGAYYFPAQVAFSDEDNGVFRMQGFTDSDPEVMLASDHNLNKEGKNQKSNYINATLNGRKTSATMEGETFGEFLVYSLMAARKASKEMLEGYVRPTPYEGACQYCRLGGSCGFVKGADGKERKAPSVSCEKIAEIVRRERGDKE